MMKKIAVLFGGNSPEYSVSLASAASVIQAIDPLKYEVMTIGIAPTMDWYWYQGNLANVRNDTWLEDHKNCHQLTFSSQGFILGESSLMSSFQSCMGSMARMAVSKDCLN